MGGRVDVGWGVGDEVGVGAWVEVGFGVGVCVATGDAGVQDDTSISSKTNNAASLAKDCSLTLSTPVKATSRQR